jgi:hypothetical protein
MYSPSPVLHYVVDASGWPSPVKRIAQVLERPLPAYLATGPYPFVTSRTSSLLLELVRSPLLQTTSNESVFFDSRPLSDVFDVVLSTVFELRDVIQKRDYGCPRQTMPLWSSLIRTLGYACSEDMSVM